MGRRKKSADEALDAAQEHLRSKEPAPAAIGGNVSDATLREFERDYVTLKAAVDEARGKLGARCKTAEAEGIDLKTFKTVLKIKKLTAPDMDARIKTFTRYTQQLGLFDAIEQYRQAEQHEENAASVDAAERELADA